MKQVAILLLEQIPHVHHLASIAFELSNNSDCEVEVIGNSNSIEVFRQLSLLYPEHKCKTTIWRSRGFRKWSERIRGKSLPRARNLLRRHTTYLMQFDMVVSSDFYTNYLVEQRKGIKPLFVFGFHGAGDAAYGFGKDLKYYDYFLISGEKIGKRLIDSGIITENQGLLVGYPKFDVAVNRPRQQFFDNNRPTVIYNPHFKKAISSWYSWGMDVLEYFYHQNQYNLIFAPHYNLFHKMKRSEVPDIPQKYMDCDHIRVDKGSYHSIDMSYTMNADLYLGDVSSQVYEFLFQLRPCLFLNAQLVDWEGNMDYKHWAYGDVINDIKDLNKGLTEAFEKHESYKEKQQIGFDETFSRTEQSAGKRAADMLLEILNKH